MSVYVKEAVLVLALLLVPMSVHADFFSRLASLFADTTEAVALVEDVDHSAIRTPLLSAASVDPVAATGGGDIATDAGVLLAAAPVTEARRQASGNNGEISVYTVREGDTLSQIAEMYGVTTNTIMWANDISMAAAVQPGDVLVILPIVGVRHTVASGETLASIIKEYDADLEEVLDYNNLASADDLSVGSELIIPGGTMQTTISYSSRPTPTDSDGGTRSALGFSHPVPGAIRTQGIHGYNGVDYAASHGTAIRAAAAGEVIVSKSSGWNGGYGQYIVIRHGNGTQTLYAHLSTNYVAAGEWVATGETIGAMGNTGRSTGTHLHFEVRGASNPF